MKPMRLGLCFSLGVHALAFGALGYVEFARHPAELPGGDEKQFITLATIAAPDDLIDATASIPPKVAVAAPIQPIKPPELAKPKPLAASPVIPIAVQPAQDFLQMAVPFATKTESKSAVATPSVTMLAVTQPAAPSSKSVESVPHSRGDGSSAKLDEDFTTRQATIGTRAQPDYRKNPEPLYPPLAKRRHQEGLVLLRVVVGADGRSKKVELKQTSGFPLLDQAAIEAVKDWDFDPARIGTAPVESEVEVPVRFSLQQ